MSEYHMHRKDREIVDPQEIREILKKGKYVVIAMCRDNEPYVATLSYGYDESKNCLYFHAALKGLKLDFFKANPLVCATVIEDGGYFADDCKQLYRSVVFWGNMVVVEPLEEKKYGMEVLLKHLEPNPQIMREKSLKTERAYNTVTILRLDIIRIYGKKLTK
jgi:uncharacterized protein